MKVRRGLIYGFLGPNGSGKTTTLGMLCGLSPRTPGASAARRHRDGGAIRGEPARLRPRQRQARSGDRAVARGPAKDFPLVSRQPFAEPEEVLRFSDCRFSAARKVPPRT